MKISFKYSVLIAGFLGILGTGCKKTLDINQSPNVPGLDQGTPQLVFPAAVMGTVARVGGDLAILGAIWGQYGTQSALSSQYRQMDSYNVDGSQLNGVYSGLFASGLKNYQFVMDRAEATGDWNYFLMGTVMKAYTTQVLADLYDQIPFSEALQGADNLNPSFDDGYSIYQTLLDEIDDALSKDFDASTNTPPSLIGNTDLIFQGNMDRWVQFANTLKLKMYLRMVNSHPTEAQAGIEDLYNSGAQFLNVSAGVSGFTNEPGRDNPMYEQNIRQLNTPDNIRASRTLVSFLEDNVDTTRMVYFFGSKNPGSIHQGDFLSTDPSYGSAARLVQRPTDPVIFISEAESYFMQAEARERYFAGAGAKDLYDQGVATSFVNMGGTATQAAMYTGPGGAYEYPSGGSLQDKIEAIITQKWIALGYGVHYIEAFFEKNRTGFPRTSPVYSDNAAYVPGQWVVSNNSVLPAGQMPRRLVFPDAETTRNANAPAVVPITTPVWWAL